MISYDVLVTGSNLKLREGFLGISTIALMQFEGRKMLFDTGGYSMRPVLIKRLKERGLELSDIDSVFLSHLHFDHAQNVDLFPHASFYVSQAELDYIADPHPDDLFVQWGIREELSKRKLNVIGEEGAFAPGLDVLMTPGHTPGCMALTWKEEGGDQVVMAGDAIKYPKEALARRCDLAFDTIETGTETMNRLLTMADRLIPGHFPELVKRGDQWTWDGETEFALVVR